MAKISIVDDENELREVVEMRLERHGFNVITANDGKEGLVKAKTENPDLIILVVMMPMMNGFQVCVELKEDEKYKNIPIILLTAMAQEYDKDAGKEVEPMLIL